MIKLILKANKDNLDLDSEDLMLLDKTYKRFARNGANLNDTEKEKLKIVNKELADLSIQFSENVLKETNAYTLHILNETELSGLPAYVVEQAAATAKNMQKEGWIFTLQYPSYTPFLQYCDHRELRKKMFFANNSRANQGNDNDNHSIISKIVNLRYTKAQLLGYDTWADYVLEERMANTKELVLDFLNNLRTYAEPAAKIEIDELAIFAKSIGFMGDTLERWDVAYYSEKLKKQKFAINDEILKPYFKLENVLSGLFEVVYRLYGLTFKKNDAIQTWHPDVVTYEVYDQNEKLMAIWYGDYFPREGKRAGAWNNALCSQKIMNSVEYRPHIVNVCNFSKPTDTKPSLLTYYEVVTLFHEFGHALHDMLAEGKYESLSGTSVAWDFVELPSQIMENFVEEIEVLKLFARHFETNEVIPDDLIQKIKESSNFMSGLAALRQISLGLIDMAWHGDIAVDRSVFDVESSADLTYPLYKTNDGIVISPSFAHIFAGGYSAGYYSYKWSEVLDADAYELFKEKGIFNRGVSDSFRENILSKGGSEKPMDLYVRFRGREPHTDAMLRREGLLTTK